jgi:hypothetical protein
MTVARATETLSEATIRTFTVKSGSAVVAGVGVFFTATEKEVDVATANSKVCGVALQSVTGDGILTVQVAMSGGIVKAKASGTATRGEYAIAGTDGFENQTIGGGTTVKYLMGQFVDSGVDNDFVGLRLGAFAAGCA